MLPAPAADVAPGASTSDVAILAGGCFWCAVHDLPKIDELKRLFPARYRVEPALVPAPGR